MSNPFTASIVDTQQQGDATFFTISIHQNPHGRPWEVIKRYSQFAQLRKILKADNVIVPKGFPSKRWTQGNSTSVVNERRVHFEEFLNNVALPHWTHPVVAQFLDLELRGRCERILSPKSSRVQIARSDFEWLCEQLRLERLSGAAAEKALLDAVVKEEETVSPASTSDDERIPAARPMGSMPQLAPLERSASREHLLPRHHLHNMQMDAEVNGLKLLNTQLLQQLQTTQRALQQARSQLPPSRLEIQTSDESSMNVTRGPMSMIPPSSPTMLQPSPILEPTRVEPRVPHLSV